MSGVGVFVSYAVLELVAVFFLLTHVLDQITGLTPAQERLLQSSVPSMVVGMVIGIVVAWLVVAAVMHFGSGGERTVGTFPDALGIAGWAYAPEIVFLVPMTANGWHQLQSLSFDGSNPEQLPIQMNEAAVQLTPNPISMVFLFLVTAWSVYILTYGVAETHDVPPKTAALPAVVVGIGSIFAALTG
ncbi:hypothetical protein C479_11505 [Halovivax asiaticus JCM 14624]|uniref:Yip1 domain-containing protein n=2 Tax=Halovivax asiaticus TaxID=332953 RepID=M0BEX3_9EURY|nr:hypothetical protein C479_11505 [Halovivax asiaticus JCM 14624]